MANKKRRASDSMNTVKGGWWNMGIVTHTQEIYMTIFPV